MISPISPIHFPAFSKFPKFPRSPNLNQQKNRYFFFCRDYRRNIGFWFFAKNRIGDFLILSFHLIWIYVIKKYFLFVTEIFCQVAYFF